MVQEYCFRFQDQGLSLTLILGFGGEALGLGGLYLHRR